MARFIDADELLNNLPDDLPYKASVKRVLIQAPTEDVVPKSEVEALKHEIERIIDEGEYWQGKYLVARSTVAREIFEEIEKDGKYAISFVENHKSYSEEVRQAKLECYKDIQTYIAELKKKYTESEEIV